MKLYGYSKKRLRATGLREMREVTLVAQPETFLKLAKFLQAQARLMRKNSVKYDHAHFEHAQDGKRFSGLIVVPQKVRTTKR